MEKVASSPKRLLSISVVSHGQMAMVIDLMQDIHEHCQNSDLELILTLNLDEDISFQASDFSYAITIIKNSTPKGFGANHNQAFRQASGQLFCVVNPDIRFESDPFPSLLEGLKDPTVGISAPLVIGPAGELEDSTRRFPTPVCILLKVFGQQNKYEISLMNCGFDPDWVGGMFMLFPHQVFQQLHGFDERYFLYYEDVDVCARLRLAGYRVAVCNRSQVVHHAQRSSHRSLKYFRWHLASMIRFFLSPVYRQLKACRSR